MDIATMAASLEGRSPMLDHRVAEFTASLPDSYRLGRWSTKSLLRDAYKDVLPEEVLRAPKRGFEVPLGAWLQNELRPLVMDTLGAASSKVRGLLDGAFIDSLLRGDSLGERNRAAIVYSMLVLELWLREFGG
jgi:asparagine synthase (glutamine-hydrolysing)